RINRLNGLPSGERERWNSRSCLQFSTHVQNPAAPRGVGRKSIHCVPAFAVWTPKVVDLGLSEVISVGKRSSGNVLRARVERFDPKSRAAIPASFFRFPAKLALQRRNQPGGLR